MKIAGRIFIIFIFFAFSPLALSQPQKTQVRDLLISKLKRVLVGLPDGSPAKIRVTLRLADLHAERGRLQAKEEMEKGCVDCTHGEKDRRQALNYYNDVLPKLKSEKLQIVLIQMGHLYEVINENTKAIGFYKKVVNRWQGPEKVEAEFSLAEIYFKQGHFQKALGHYQKVLKENSFKKKGFAGFRLAWCRYNTGDISGAVSDLENILNNPKLLTRNMENSSRVDEDFKEEIAKDYTVFMAHSRLIGLDAIEKVFKLSPKQNRLENILFLAKELERLGRVQQSEKAWELVIEKTDQPQVRLEALLELTNLSLKREETKKLLSYFKRTLNQWKFLSQVRKKTQSEQIQFEELKNRLRNIVFEWNRSEREKGFSKELLMAYEVYFQMDSKNFEAFQLASQAAIRISDFFRAYNWNEKAISLAKDSELESLLVQRIEISELAKNQKWLISAQNLYLKKSKEKSKLSEIRYQMAQGQYDKKNYEVAAKQFQKLARDSSVSSKLRLQSAEMALDSLVLAENDSAIEICGKDFAKIFPDRKKHFLGLVNQSVLSQTAQFSSKPNEAWTILNRFNVSHADPEKLKIYHKNRIILARKLKKFDEMNASLQFFLKFKNLTEKERRFALESKVWLNEIQLDFNGAYLAYRELNTGDWLQLARFADLAEKPSEKYYFQYLKRTKDQKLAFSICLKLVETGETLRGPYGICESRLKKNKEVFANLIVDIYGKKVSPVALFNKMKTYGVEKTWAGSVVHRDLLIKRGGAQLKKLKNHKLKNRHLTSSIKYRLNLIASFEKVISDAAKTGDWLVQILFLSDLKVQYVRFFEDLMALLVPGGLSDEEQREYMTLLNQQAAPYREKAGQIELKLDELWKDQKSQDQLYSNFHKTTDTLQSLLGPQIERLKFVANGGTLSELLNLVYRQPIRRKLSSVFSLEEARQRVRQKPMDKKAIRKLIELETVRGYQPMIIYLNSRLEKLDQNIK